MKLRFKKNILEVKETIENQYNEYLKEHIDNVKKGYQFIKEKVSKILEDCVIENLDKMIENHDDSKYSEEEFLPYAEHFYGQGKVQKIDHEFDRAWKHHCENNPHHPEYWKGEEMDSEHIIEMICDWWSFSWKKGNLKEIFDFYNSNAKNDKDKNIHPATKLLVEKYLKVLETYLTKESL